VCLLLVSCTEEEARDRRKKAEAKEGTRRVPGYAGGVKGAYIYYALEVYISP
jgi:hypothetical protein